MTDGVVGVRNFIYQNRKILPYTNLSQVESQLVFLSLNHFHIATQDFSYKDGSKKALIGFSGLIEHRNSRKLAIVGWLTPDFPKSAPDVYVLPKFDEVVVMNHQMVSPCGKIQISYLTQWGSHSTLANLLVELVQELYSWPPLENRSRKTKTVSFNNPGITDVRLKNALKQLFGDFPKLEVHVQQGNTSSPIPFVSGYFPISYHGEKYKIQIHMWLDGFPHQAPQVYVKWDPTKARIIEDSNYVNPVDGAVRTPLLQNWTCRQGFEDHCTLVGLIWNLVDLFSLQPPVRSGVCVSQKRRSKNSNEDEKTSEEVNSKAGNDGIPSFERSEEDRENERKIFAMYGWGHLFDK